MNRTNLLFLALILGIILISIADLLWGTVTLSAREVWGVLIGDEVSEASGYIIRNFRIPKLLTSLLAGAGVAIAGLQMQCLFRNPLADTSILGINSGAGVGVAIYTMAYALLPSVSVFNSGVSTWGTIISACLGSLLVLLLISVVAGHVRNLVYVLIIGVMIGFFASSLISILQFLSDEETLKTYLLWSFGSVASTTWRQLYLLAPMVLLGLGLSLLMPKGMNALALGENYARSVGVDVRMIRFALIGTTSLLAGSITAFTGPIAFLGLAVPHLVRLGLRTSDHRILIPATMLMGALVLTLCDILTQSPGRGVVLPINAITSLIGAPVVVAIVWKNSKGKSMSL